MKYRVLFFSFLFASCAFTINAQILNAGFEDWSASGNPNNWTATNAPPSYITILKTSDAHSGSWAAEGDVVLFSVFTIGPSLYSGENTEGFAVNFRPGALKGYYKFTSVQSDFLQVQANFKKNGTYMGVGANNLSPVGTYTQFSIDITYLSADVPDTVIIAIFASNSTGFPHVGTKMFIDDLAWGSATDITDKGNQIPDKFSLEQNYPNPFNPSTKIHWQSPISGQQSLKIYNVLGDEVATLVDEYKPAGNYEIEFNASHLSSGIYFYKLEAEDFTETKKMILLK